MNPDGPNIPDLDPRSDAHIIGRLTLSRFLILLGGIGFLTLLLMSLGSAIWGALPSLILTVVLGGLWSLWIIAEGPETWMRRRHWRQRQGIRTRLSGWPVTFIANQAADPFWTADGATWAVAQLTLPPVVLLDEDRVAAWHHRLAQALQMAIMHGLMADVRTAQLPGSWIVPQGDLNPVTAARWQWWMQSIGPQSIHDTVIIRLGWPTTERNTAALHFLSVEQAWRSIPGPGDWQWLSAATARQLVDAAANPAQTYALWSQAVRQAVAAEPDEPGLRRRKRASAHP